MNIPPEALDAAIEALKTRSAAGPRSMNEAAARWHAVVTLEAAAPLIAAAERERIAVLAEGEARRIDPPGSYSIHNAQLSRVLEDFADLLKVAP